MHAYHLGVVHADHRKGPMGEANVEQWPEPESGQTLAKTRGETGRTWRPDAGPPCLPRPLPPPRARSSP